MAERICCVCRVKQPTPKMVRIVRVREHNGAVLFFLDKEHKLNGRGCHICPYCIKKAVKTKALDRSFKYRVDENVYRELEKASQEINK
jgi:predicted RNA-binding protein YlxR (DUF448 family)